VAALPQPVFAAAELAKQLSNSIANLTSVPFQFNYDSELGPNNTDRTILNIQPVVPFNLGGNWNLLSRTILPVIDLEAPAPGFDDEAGIGDVVQSCPRSSPATALAYDMPLGGGIYRISYTVIWLQTMAHLTAGGTLDLHDFFWDRRRIVHYGSLFVLGARLG
jgi:hypothetical protein